MCLARPRLRRTVETLPTMLIYGGPQASGLSVEGQPACSQGVPRGRWWEALRQFSAGCTDPQASASKAVPNCGRDRHHHVAGSTARELPPQIPAPANTLILNSGSESQNCCSRSPLAMTELGVSVTSKLCFAPAELSSIHARYEYGI